MVINSFTLPLAYIIRSVGKLAYIRGWNSLVSMLFPVGSQSAEETSFDFYGLIYTGKLNNHIDWMAFFYGAYEKALLKVLGDYASRVKDCVFVDVGANVGHHSLYLSKYCAEVHAFEPLPVLYQEIEKKIERNGIKNIHVHKCGLGDEAGEFTYYMPEDKNHGMGSFVARQTDNTESVRLRIENGVEYLAANKITRIDIIKIDVEGYEPRVLRGLRDDLVRNRPMIIIEVGGLNTEVFSSLDAVKQYLPAHYKIMFLQVKGVLVYQYDICEMTEKLYNHFSDNLICMPDSIRL